MKYRDAERRMAELVRDMMASGCERMSQDDPVASDSPEYTRAKNAVKQFGNELAADPTIFPLLVPWMVDVHGQGACSNEMTEDIVSDALGNGINHLNDVIAERAPLASSVRSLLESEGFKITDSGFGSCCWHLGVPCTDSEAQRLCCLLYSVLAKQITAGIVRIDRHFWGWRLPTLYNNGAVEKYWVEKGNDTH